MDVRMGTDEEKELILTKYPYTSQVMRPGGSLVIAVENSEIAGFCWSFSREIPVPVGKTEEFVNVVEVFREENRRRGIGSLMIKKCMETAKEQGSYQVRAYCDMNNLPSHMLWVKNGFTISPVKMEDGQIVGSYVAYRL